MPNDRAKDSLLKNIDLKKYPRLKQFLSLQSLSESQDIRALTNTQALDLLDQAIEEVEKPDSSSSSSSVGSFTSRKKELDVKNIAPLPESQTKIESSVKIEQDSGVEQKSAEKVESAEILEIGQEIAEIKEIDKEKEDQELIKEQQIAINNLSNQAQTTTDAVEPVVVLPITETQEKLAKKKDTHFSLRWLAEWAEKIKKIFAGAVLYKEEVENSADV